MASNFFIGLSYQVTIHVNTKEKVGFYEIDCNDQCQQQIDQSELQSII